MTVRISKALVAIDDSPRAPGVFDTAAERARRNVLVVHDRAPR